MHTHRRIVSVSFLKVLCALFFLCLIEGRTLAQKQPAQQPKLTTKTVPDNLYGEGGTKETTSDEKFKIYREVWKDKKGEIREVHEVDYDSAKELRSESWSFI